MTDIYVDTPIFSTTKLIAPNATEGSSLVMSANRDEPTILSPQNHPTWKTIPVAPAATQSQQNVNPYVSF